MYKNDTANLENSLTVPPKVKELPCDPKIIIPKYISKRMKNTCSPKTS